MPSELTALDQAIGDGDHGANMKRGFDAVAAEAEAIAEKPLPEALKAIGTKLVMTVGGASGPLYGTLFLTLGKELPASPTGRRSRGIRQGGGRGRSARQVASAGKRPCSTCSIRWTRRSPPAGRPRNFATCASMPRRGDECR